MRRNPTALIVDDDVGAIFWFGDIFGKAGWNLVPALNCRQALSVAVMWESYIDVVLVNAALTGVPEMVEALSRVHRPKVVLVRDQDVQTNIPADAIIDRPDMNTPLSRAESAERVHRLLGELIR